MGAPIVESAEPWSVYIEIDGVALTNAMATGDAPTVVLTITSTGCSVTINNSTPITWLYSGSDTFLGFSTTQGATDPDTTMEVGDTLTYNTRNLSLLLYSVDIPADPVPYLTTDQELASVANAIRAKSGTIALLEYPSEFISTIQAIPTGTLRTSDDLIASGARVIVPAGVYSSGGSKSVASGSASTPATTITANPSISVSSSGLITASASATKSVTPTVSAGYVSSGTAGTITVSGSNTSQLTTQAAQTLYPSTTDQTIASGKYLTGTQTIKGVLLTNLTADNIKKDVVVKVGDSADDDRITSVTGTYEGSGGGGSVTTVPIRLPFTTTYYTNGNMQVVAGASGSGDAAKGSIAIGIGMQEPMSTVSGVTLLTSKGSGANTVRVYEVTG